MAKKIKIYGNATKGCIFFDGSTVDPKFLGTVFCDLNATDASRLVIKRNDRRMANGEYRVLFRQLNPSRVQNEAGENLVDDLGFSVTDVCDYINEQATAVAAPSTGNVFSGATALDFTRDETKTSILFSNGDHHGINSLKAVAKENGKVAIMPMRGDVELYEIEFASCTINGNSPATTIETTVNDLNALFTLSAQTLPVAAPVYTQLDGVDVSWESSETINPTGTGLHGSGTPGTYYHGPRVWTADTINEPGEYFTFEAKNVLSGGGPLLGIGLYSVADGDLAEVVDDSLSNSGHHGYFFSTWMYNYSGYSAPWTTYGSASGISYGPGFSFYGNEPMFRYSDANTIFRVGEGNVDGSCLFKCGITDTGFVGVWYYDIESEDVDGTYGARTNDWILLARSSTPVSAGEYGLMVKIPSTSGQIMSVPRRFATDPAAPTLYYRYIESPDGEFHYPLFATEEEANYVSGDGTSHQHVYADDTVPGTVWYMPNTGGTMDAAAAPVSTSEITYTEIPTQDDTNFVPPAFPTSTFTINEGDILNYQTQPVDTAYTTIIGGFLAPGWSTSSDGRLIGTAPEVTGDNVANPSDTYQLAVFRTNDFGTSTGVLEVVVNNLTAPVVDTGDFTVDTGSIVAGVLQEDSLADLSFTIEEGDRVIVPKAWVDAHVQPNSLGSLEKIYMGVLKDGTSTTDITLGDFNCCFQWEGDAASTFHRVRMDDQLGASTSNISFTNSGVSIYDYAFEIYNGDLWLIACNVNSLNTEPAAGNGGSFSRTLNCGPLTDNGLSSPFTLKVGTHVGTVIDLDDALTSEEITKIDIPDPPAPVIITPWTKALDFSGSAERAEMVSTSTVYNPMMMAGAATTVSAPASGKTVTNGHPWATTCVFNRDANSAQQHIWNIGEGAGSSDDNIYLRTTGFNGALYFGWGSQGALNEYLISTSLGSAAWYGVYVGFNGRRLSGNDATAANLAQCFSIKLMFSQAGGWDFNPNPTSPPGAGTWSTTGGRMDRSVTGALTLGGRGTNRSYHGQLASFVTTTLKCNDDMPDNDEIKEMITDPLGWMATYKEGNTFRRSYFTDETNWDTANTSTKGSGTQIFLMGDGTNDSYSNMIRNQVAPTDQNYTKLNMLSMVSNDIQTVSIGGLT